MYPFIHAKKYSLILLFLLYNTICFSQTVILTSSSGTWSVPTGVTSITVDAWGAGGAGGGSTSNKNGGSGGGGGGNTSAVLAVTPGQNIAYTIGVGGLGVVSGDGGDGFGNTTFLTLTANSGTGGEANKGLEGTGGTASGGTNTTGLNGTTGNNSGGAGGAGANGGAGGAGGVTNGNGLPGAIIGGGGSGGEDGSAKGGDGARGQINITYTAPNPCVSATTLACGATNLAGTTVGSPLYTNGTGCSMSNYGAWYTFVGDGQQTTISSTAGSGFDHEMSISSGTCGSLTNIVCRDSGLSGGIETYTFTTGIGVNYYVYIAHYSTGTTTGTFTISRTCTPAPTPPANDNCAGATVLTVNPTLICTTTTAGTVTAATNSGVASACFGTSDDDVWYRFVATSTVHHVSLLNTAGSTTDLYHAVFSGASGCGSLGAALICSDPNNSIVTGLTIGNTYYVQVYTYTSTTGQTSTFDVCIGTPPPPPANDNCTGAVSLTVNPDNLCGTVTAGTVASATNSGVSSACFGTSDDDVWYRFVATSTTHYVSLLNVAGSTTDLYHAVYSGASGCGSLGAALLCSDPNTSTVTGLTIGNTYYVQVYSYTSTTNQTTTFNICIGTPPPPPVNDNCSGAIALTVNPTVTCTTTTTGSVASATNSGIASACFGTSDDDIWYSFVATSTEHYVSLLNVAGSTTDLYHAVYSGASGCGSLGAALVCSDPNNSTVTGLTIGNTYFVQVYSYTSTSGQNTTFNICIGTNVPCTPGPGTGTTTLGCPTVVSGGLGLNGADPAPFNCTSGSTCVDLEAVYLPLGQTTTYKVESIPYAPPYQFSCLANPVSVNIDDRWSPVINLPFDFCYYGNTYSTCTIGSNGILSFDITNAGNGTGYLYSSNLPSTTGALFANTIYGTYHDIDPSKGGEVGWELVTLNSGCRALVASWSDVPMYSNNSLLYTGMMVLYENTNVIEVYIKEKRIDGTWNDGNALVGVQNATGTAAVVAPGRNSLDTDWTVTNEAWRFIPDGTSITSIAWHEGSGVSGPIVGTTDVINVCPSTTTTYTAEITYALCDGSTLKETEETTVTVNSGKIWNGSVSTNWNAANNWTPTGVPTLADCVLIPVTVNDPIVSGVGFNGQGLNLTVQNGATLTVNGGNSLTITDWVNINATGTFMILDDASLIQINNVGNTGNITMDRTASIRLQDYVYWSSPVANFDSTVISPLTQTSLIWKWEPTVSANTNGFGIWVSGNENMINGKGYIVRGPSTYTNTLQDYTATFNGVANNGIISTPVLRGTYDGIDYVGPTSTMVTKEDDNWNLIGNPYPSAIDAIDFLTLNTNIDGFIKVWTHGTLPVSTIDPFYQDFVYNYTLSDYITYNSSGASSGPGAFGGYIAAAQGFFVSMLHSSISDSETVSFNNTMRSSLYNNSQFFKNSNTEIEKNRIWLDLIGTDNSNVRTLIGYIENATNDRDRLYDAVSNSKINFNLYSQIEEESFLIQGKSLPFNINDKVKLGMKIPATGEYKISIAALDGLFETTNQNIYIEDLENNIIHNLRLAPYSFNTTEGVKNDRFVLRFTDNKTNNEDVENLENNIFVISNNNLSVKSTNELIKSITIHDVIGRLIDQKENVNSNEIIFNSIQKNNTTLLLRIVLKTGTVINKKVIF